ncbi:Predicted membrane protein [Phaffia rhodozyma]|uniref:Predicted membrane protein n=1 Tax=Phaffia rhodozyma TaxID=264483 RepID=A0A0F7SIK4_PHARH|nr:Predicted membrane protein [Phaffia rhodozyma]
MPLQSEKPRQRKTAFELNDADGNGPASRTRTPKENPTSQSTADDHSLRKDVTFNEKDIKKLEEEGEKSKRKLPPGIWPKIKWMVMNNGVLQLDWIPGVMNWRSLKPLIRCSIAGWIAMLLLIISPTEKILGTASFFTLVIAFLTPPDKSFPQNAELHFFSMLFVAISWAWVCIAAAICSAVRENPIPSSEAVAADIYAGGYLEAKTSIVCAVFLGFGSGFFCWLKARTAPSPITLPCVLACIQMDVALTLIPLYPYDFYTSGLVFFIPMAIQVGVHLVLSVFLFPQSVSYLYLNQFCATLSPLESSMTSMKSLFESAAVGNASLNEWIELGVPLRADKVKSETVGFGAMSALRGSLGMDVSWGRLGAKDLERLGKSVKDVTLRSGGITFFFDIFKSALTHDVLDSNAFHAREALGQDLDDNESDRLDSRPGSVYQTSQPPSRATSPSSSHENLPRLNSTAAVARSQTKESVPIPSRPRSELERDPESSADEGPGSGRDSPATGSGMFSRERTTRFSNVDRSRSSWTSGRKRADSPSRSHARDHHHHHHSTSHFNLLEKLRKSQEPVGLFESHRYMDLEKKSEFQDDHIHYQLQLLASSSLPLVRALDEAIKHAIAWAERMNNDRSLSSTDSKKFRGDSFLKANDQAIEALKAAIIKFKTVDRLSVIEPFTHLFDPSHPANHEEIKNVPHRDLFWCFALQFNLLAFGDDLLRLCEDQQAIELKRPKQRLWFPVFDWKQFIPTREQEECDGQQMGEQDPERIDGFKPRADSVVMHAQARDPDTLEPSTVFLAVLARIHKAFSMLKSNQFMFACKAGIITVLVATPSWTPGSAKVFYANRGLWALIMAQLTLGMFSGETTMAWVARVVATFWGCVTGLLIWSIGAPGDHIGNHYGMAAVTAVAFPIVFLFRLYYPSPPLTKILYSVSTALVVGYSWQNAHGIRTTNASWGFDVAWRRFTLVMIGITAAWIWSSVPPVASGKRNIRASYSRVITTTGDALCAIVSYSNDVVPDEEEHARIEGNLIAVKKKLNQLELRHKAVTYEISFRGTWPIERYTALKSVLSDIVTLMNQLHFIMGVMDPAWKKALLIRTRLSDPRFMGDVLAVISLCSTALQSKSPLPQITPCPLVERYLERRHGLLVVDDENIDHRDVTQENEKAYPRFKGVPRRVTVDILKSEEYLRFSMACATCFALVGRFDKMMLICKTLLGETFHLAGVADYSNYPSPV